jgi:AraC-like DNA-binding protein
LAILEQANWSITQLELPGSLHIQMAAEGSGNVAEGAIRQDGLVLFTMKSCEQSRANGQELGSGSLLVMPPGSDFHLQIPHAHEWLSIYIPETTLSRMVWLSEFIEYDRSDVRVLGPVNGLAGELWALLIRFLSWSASAPGVIDQSASADAFDAALMACLNRLPSETARDSKTAKGRPRVIDQITMSHIAGLIESQPHSVKSAQDLVALTGISERTLQAAFNKYYGLSSARYIQLRRLHQARKLLARVDDHETTVSTVATSLGMWDLGRFAGRYRNVFGELPSVTLQRARRALG